jgi:hypothetical protein
MANPLRLRKQHLLPAESVEIAKLVRGNQPVDKNEIKSLVEDGDSLEDIDLEKHIRLLRMSDNIVVEDRKASIKPVRCGESGVHVMEKFRRWKRKAQNS